MLLNSKRKKILVIFCVALLLLLVWEIYIPRSFFKQETIKNYTIQKGQGFSQIAQDLKTQGVIKSAQFFKLYVIVSGNYDKLQAGNYQISSSMPVAELVTKFSTGNVIKNTITIIEGWDLQDVGAYLESKNIAKEDFLAAAKKDYSSMFDFLKTKPKKLSLEGFLFPDTYQLDLNATKETIVRNALLNFDEKLTPDLRAEIAKQQKSIFDVVIMASLIEKEVKSEEDKKIVAGILWKRLDTGMPLQVDATINYITGKNNPSATIKDTYINSPYNTYKYQGLPLGPICNPGMESILAAIYPQKSDYWFYLSASATGKTIFSKNYVEHNAAIAKYLR